MKILLSPTRSRRAAAAAAGARTSWRAELRARGHAVLVVKVIDRKSRARARTSLRSAFRVIEYQFFAPNLPGIRNYFKNERLYPRLASRLEDVDRHA